MKTNKLLPLMFLITPLISSCNHNHTIKITLNASLGYFTNIVSEHLMSDQKVIEQTLTVNKGSKLSDLSFTSPTFKIFTRREIDDAKPLVLIFEASPLFYVDEQGQIISDNTSFNQDTVLTAQYFPNLSSAKIEATAMCFESANACSRRRLKNNKPPLLPIEMAKKITANFTKLNSVYQCFAVGQAAADLIYTFGYIDKEEEAYSLIDTIINKSTSLSNHIAYEIGNTLSGVVNAIEVNKKTDVPVWWEGFTKQYIDYLLVTPVNASVYVSSLTDNLANFIVSSGVYDDLQNEIDDFIFSSLTRTDDIHKLYAIYSTTTVYIKVCSRNIVDREIYFNNFKEAINKIINSSSNQIIMESIL